MDPTTLTKDEFPTLRNVPVYTTDGDQIGTVGDAYYDEQTERLECVAVAGDALGMKKRVIPVRGGRLEDGALYLPYAREDVDAAPDYDDDEVDEDRYAGVTDYYRSRGDADAEVVRSEEELRVGKQETEAGRVRLRKWVETEPVEEQVELRQERARVEREPIDQPVSGAEMGDEEVEVQLKSERPVVQKETVAKERVGIEKDVETEHQRVQDEVRKERVEVEGEADETR